MHLPEDTPLKVEIDNKQLVIRIGIDTLAHSANHHNNWRDDDDESRLKVTDAMVFAGEVMRALQHEEEDGTTPIDVMFDEAITCAIEDGAEGIDVREASLTSDDDDYEDSPYDGGNL